MTIPRTSADSPSRRPPNPPPPTRPKKKKRAPGWIPNYHGAWAMITVPVIMGIIVSGFVWEHLLLLGLWWIGYFAFFATSLWLRSRRRDRFFPPVRAYGIALIPFGIGLLLTAPYLMWWVPLFVPLIAITAWASINRMDRSLLNDVVTVVAAGLTLPVAYDLGTGGRGGIWGTSGPETLPGTSADAVLTGWPWIWLVTLMVTAYFVGTAFYVKTNIRERGSTFWLGLSIAFHGVFFLLALALAFAGTVTPWHAVVWLLLVGRAVAIPLYGARYGWVSALAIGIGEIVFSLLIAMTLLLS